MIFILRDLAVIYAFSLFAGIGLYALLATPFLRGRGLVYALAPGIGLVQTMIACAYMTDISRPIGDAIPISASLALLTIVITVLIPHAKTNLFRSFALSKTSVGKAVVCVLVLAAILTPVWRAGYPTTPYRIGIDQVGYAQTAQYLVEGGSLRRARTTLLQQLGTHDLEKAKLQNIRAVNFGTYVNTEFLLKAFRWGFPGLVAALTILTGSGHVFRIEFLLVIFGCALLLIVAYRILRDVFSLPATAALAVATALTLNCNLLNVYYEGELTQPFMLPYFVLALILYLQVRGTMRDQDGLRAHLSRHGKALALFALFVAALFSAYNETMVLLVGFIALVTALDAVFSRRFYRGPLLFAAAGIGIGFVAVFPISHQWFTYSVANIRNLSHAGFWQPHWGSFAEILGIFNMYGTPGYVLDPRTTLNLALNIFVSVITGGAYLLYLCRARGIDTSFWAAPAVLIAAAFLKMRYVDHILNYPYMKVYTMLAPLLVIAAFAGFYLLARDARLLSWAGKFTARARSVMLHGQYAALAVVIASGAAYIFQYTVQSAYVTSGMFAMYQYHNGHRRFNQLALLSPHANPPVSYFMLVPLISANLVNQSGGEKYIAPFLNAPVAIVFQEHDLPCRQCLIARDAKRVVYANDSYVVLKTGARLRDICVPQANLYRIDELSDGSQKNWPGLPAPQCDFQITLRFLAGAQAGSGE